MAIPVCGGAQWFLKAIIRRKEGSPKGVSRFFPYKFLQIQIASVSGHGMHYIFNIVSNRCRHEYDSLISRFFLNLIFGGFFTLGPSV